MHFFEKQGENVSRVNIAISPYICLINDKKCKSIVNRLAQQIIDLTNSDSKIVYKQGRDGEVKYSLSDISKISQIGFKPEINLKEGLEN